MNYHVTILSPVHIGNGNSRTPFDFIITDGQLVVVNLAKVLAGNPQRVDALNRQIERDPVHFSLSDFLTPEERSSPGGQVYSADLDASTKSVFHEQLRKGDKLDVAEMSKTPINAHIYLPGSTLKGAFRTAVAYAALRTYPPLWQALKQRLEHIDWRWSDEAVEDLLFCGAQTEPAYDFFRTVSFSDSSGVTATEQTLQIGKMKILSLKPTPKKEMPKQGTMYKQLETLRSSLTTRLNSPLKPWWTLLELVKPGVTFTGTTAWEERFMHDARAKKIVQWKAPHQTEFTIEQILKAANLFAAEICAWELNFFERQVEGLDVTPIISFYRDLQAQIQHAAPLQAYLCLGQGAGWHKVTIGMLLERDLAVNFKRLRRDLRLAEDRLNFEYPKSRPLLMQSVDLPQGVPGWVAIQFA